MSEEDRPYIICHILSSIDGRIDGALFGAPESAPARSAYGGLRAAFGADATAYGTVTTQGFIGSRTPELALDEKAPSLNFVAADAKPPFYVSIDPKGELAWEDGAMRWSGRPDSHVIEVLGAEASDSYRSYLQKRGVSYITAGQRAKQDDEGAQTAGVAPARDTEPSGRAAALDLAAATRLLKRLFGIERMLVCGGGATDAAFLAADLIDELSVVVAPVATGENGVATLFDEAPFAQVDGAVAFGLVRADALAGSALHLTYRSPGTASARMAG